MKKVLFAIIFSLPALNIFAQFFEGKIKYRVTPKSPNPIFMSEEEYKKKNPNKTEHVETFYFKHNAYKYINGNEVEVLDPSKQRVYSYTIGADTCLWNDATFVSDEVLDIKKSAERDTILGSVCEALIIRTTWEKTTYFFDRTKLKVDATQFATHKFKQWSYFLSESGCLPLKIVRKTAFDCLVYIAVDLKEEPLPEKEFAVPAFKYPIKNHHQ